MASLLAIMTIKSSYCQLRRANKVPDMQYLHSHERGENDATLLNKTTQSAVETSQTSWSPTPHSQLTQDI